MATKRKLESPLLNTTLKKCKKELSLPLELIYIIIGYNLPVWKTVNKKLIYPEFKKIFNKTSYLSLVNKEVNILFTKFIKRFHLKEFKVKYEDIDCLTDRLKCLKNFQGYLERGLTSLYYPFNYNQYDRILYHILFLRNNRWVLNTEKIIVCNGSIDNTSESSNTINNINLRISKYEQKEEIYDNIFKYTFKDYYNIGVRFSNIRKSDIAPFPLYTFLASNEEIFNIKYVLDSESTLCYKNNNKWVDCTNVSKIHFAGYNISSVNITEMILTIKLIFTDPEDDSFYTYIFAKIHPF